MGALVTTELDGSVATITLDDGKVNVLSPAMQSELHAALDEAEAAGAVALLTGRGTVFSAGFDLAILNGGGAPAIAMLTGGFELAERLLSFPTPVVVACPGNAVAMGLFLLLAADHRVGAAGPFRLQANEVAIGLTMPRAAVEVCRQRLTPAGFDRAVILAEPFGPEEAVTVGMLDRVAPAEELLATARATAETFAALDPAAHTSTKQRARAGMLTALRAAIEADDADLRALF